MKSNTSIKVLIWAYLVLLIFEGSLRKWIFPGWSKPLLVVRDPVLLGIYALSLSNGVFPNNGTTRFLMIMSAASAVLAMVLGHGNLFVVLFGVRANFLHVPLIWIMGSVLTRRDLVWIGVFLMAVSIPNTLLMIRQYNASPDDWLNWGAGGPGTGQISGSGDHIRPAGFFSFITGPAALYPLVTAVTIYAFLGTNHFLRILGAAAVVATAVAIPVSISRSLFLSVAIVAATGAICAVVSGKIATNVVKIALLVGVLALAIPRVPVFREALKSFTDRWELATSDVKNDIGMRWASTFLEAFDTAGNVPFFGNGIGSGTNVASGIASESQYVFFGEGEWGRAVGEMGPILGFTFLGFRTWLTFHLVGMALASWRRYSDAFPFLLCSAGGMNVLVGQWGIPTSLGFAVFGAGLIMAAGNTSAPRGAQDGDSTKALEMPATRRLEPHENERRPRPTKKVVAS